MPLRAALVRCWWEMCHVVTFLEGNLTRCTKSLTDCHALQPNHITLKNLPISYGQKYAPRHQQVVSRDSVFSIAQELLANEAVKYPALDQMGPSTPWNISQLAKITFPGTM